MKYFPNLTYVAEWAMRRGLKGQRNKKKKVKTKNKTNLESKTKHAKVKTKPYNFEKKM